MLKEERGQKKGSPGRAAEQLTPLGRCVGVAFTQPQSQPITYLNASHRTASYLRHFIRLPTNL